MNKRKDKKKEIPEKVRRYVCEKKKWPFVAYVGKWHGFDVYEGRPFEEDGECHYICSRLPFFLFVHSFAVPSVICVVLHGVLFNYFYRRDNQ